MHLLPKVKALFFLIVPILCFSLVASATEMAITVDDLPSHDDIPQSMTRLEVAQKMIAVLKKHHVPDVYGFINGVMLHDEKDTPQVLTAWINAGFHLGNHTFTHKNLSAVSESEFFEDVRRNDPILSHYANGDDFHYFRFPYLEEGDTPQKTRDTKLRLKEMGYKIAEVTADYNDWAFNTPFAKCRDAHKSGIIQKMKIIYFQAAMADLDYTRKVEVLLFGHEIKNILLLHLGGFNLLALDAVLTAYEQRGVKFIGLREALKDPVYSQDPQLSGFTRDTLLDQIAEEKQITLPPKPRVSLTQLDSFCQ